MLSTLVLVAGLVAIVSVLRDQPAPKPSTSPEAEAFEDGRFASLLAGGERRARLVDLCDDEDAI